MTRLDFWSESTLDNLSRLNPTFSMGRLGSSLALVDVPQP